MRVVLDTNILARAVTGPNGPAAEVLRLLVPPHRLILSPFLLTELLRVLGYTPLRRLHMLSDAEIVEYVAVVQRQAVLPFTYGWDFVMKGDEWLLHYPVHSIT